MIIAFIGGLQQATACAEALSPSYVVGAIGIAIAGWVCAAAAGLGHGKAALAGLSLLFAAQGAAEAAAPLPPAARASMLADERRAPMAVAAAALAVAAALP